MFIVFDFDGTLHVSAATYMPAFRETLAWLETRGQTPACDLDEAAVGYWLGVDSAQMWALVAPDAPRQLREACAEHMRATILQLARAGQARLYEHIPETLDALSDDGHELVLLSNCRHDYLKTFTDVFGLTRWFAHRYCGQDYGWAPKSEVFARIAAQLGHAGVPPRDEFVVVGDRYHDIGIAREHGLRSVGCAYGYGSRDELADASVIAESSAELLGAIRSIVS